ncbi:MAG: cytochrome P450 [Pirellulaceae bacterium]|nr:cytochrome P450 [Pirellulaceae bacterium]
MEIDYDPRNREVIADPFPVFQRLREQAPVYFSSVLGGWVLTRYDDVKLVISDRRFSADRMRPFFAQLPMTKQCAYATLRDSISAWAVFHDPPTHTRLRGLINRAFTVKAIERLEPRIDGIVVDLLDQVAHRGEMDVIADLAYPLPASVILHMLGLPSDDLDRIKVWSDELALFVGSSVNTPDKYRRATDSITAMNDYFGAAIQRRRQAPGDDLLSALLAAQEQEELLSHDELVATCVLLVFAGHETTTNLIGNGMLALLRHPAQLERLRSELELLPLAIEELLRFDGPAAAVVRIATEEVTLHDQTIAAGDRVFAMLGAANRDPRQFSNPEKLDITRNENRHIAFGHGIHYCIGAPLARLEAKLAIRAILQRCQNLKLQDAALHWSDSLVLRGVRSLPISFVGQS